MKMAQRKAAAKSCLLYSKRWALRTYWLLFTCGTRKWWARLPAPRFISQCLTEQKNYSQHCMRRFYRLKYRLTKRWHSRKTLRKCSRFKVKTRSWVKELQVSTITDIEFKNRSRSWELIWRRKCTQQTLFQRRTCKSGNLSIDQITLWLPKLITNNQNMSIITKWTITRWCLMLCTVVDLQPVRSVSVILIKMSLRLSWLKKNSTMLSKWRSNQLKDWPRLI